MSSEKICTLSVDHAIRIAKIIATAPVERLPMITQLFHQASVDLEGLEELIENTALSAQGSLIDTGEFLAELTAGRELTEKPGPIDERGILDAFKGPRRDAGMGGAAD